MLSILNMGDKTRWIYVLACEGGRILVGSSGNLLAKFTEHTIYGDRIYWPTHLMGMYRVDPDQELAKTNDIVLKIMTMRADKWHQVRGGSYTRHTVGVSTPPQAPTSSTPYCRCGLSMDTDANGAFICPRTKIIPHTGVVPSLSVPPACQN